MATTAKKSTKTVKAKSTPKSTSKVAKSSTTTTKAVKTNKPTTKKPVKKTGKKCLIVIIVVAVLAVLVAAGFCVYNKFFAFPDIAGTYELTGMEADGEDQSASLGVLKGLGLEATLELRDDKTGELNLFGEKSDVTYDKDQMTIDKDATDYDYKDGTITLEEDGTKLTFTLQQ